MAPMATRSRPGHDGPMPGRTGQSDDGRDWSRFIGEFSRVVVISTSVLATIAAVVLLTLVILTFLGIAG
jgi:hypothetical protein